MTNHEQTQHATTQSLNTQRDVSSKVLKMTNKSSRTGGSTGSDKKSNLSVETGAPAKNTESWRKGIQPAKLHAALISANLISSNPSGHIKLTGKISRENNESDKLDNEDQDSEQWVFRGKWSYNVANPQELDFCYRPGGTPTSSRNRSSGNETKVSKHSELAQDDKDADLPPSGKWNGSFTLGKEARPPSNRVGEVISFAMERVEHVDKGASAPADGKIASVTAAGGFEYAPVASDQKLVNLQGEGSNRYGDFIMNGRYDATSGEFIGIKTYLLRRRNRSYVEGGEVRHSKRQRMPNRMLQSFGSVTSPNGTVIEGSEVGDAPNQNTEERSTQGKSGKGAKTKTTKVKSTPSVKVEGNTTIPSHDHNDAKDGDDQTEGRNNEDEQQRDDEIGGEASSTQDLKKRKVKPGLAPKLQQKGKRIRGVGSEWTKATVDSQGEVYEGSFLNGERHGFGTCGFPTGELYEGDWLDGKEHGRGILTDMNGSLIYQGEFQDGRINGKGTFFYTNGDRYDGEWRDGMRHGYGVYRTAQGDVFEGDWVHNKRSGQGLAIGADGSTYEGEWHNDLRCGRGYLRLASGFMFDGTFKDNLMDGRGVCTYADQSRYEGVWREGKKNGRGTYVFTNGATYEGRFRDDQVHGTGTLKMKQGAAVHISPTEWVLPINCQHELRYVHLRAGFGVDGK